jgi:hypothetical protein
MIEKIKKYLLVSSILALLFFRKDLVFPTRVVSSDDVRADAQARTVLIGWDTQTWSGVIFSENTSGINILTIIHKESMKKIKASGSDEVNVTTEAGEELKAKIISWDSCQEISMLKISNNAHIAGFAESKLEAPTQYLSESLFSFGHPLGLRTHYSQGFLTSKDIMIKDCGMITYGFSGGTMPGQTGSGVWNDKGELSGLIVATSAYQIKTLTETGGIIGYSNMPVDFLGRYIPSGVVASFIKNPPKFDIEK